MALVHSYLIWHDRYSWRSLGMKDSNLYHICETLQNWKSYQFFVMLIDEGLPLMDYATYVPNTQGQ